MDQNTKPTTAPKTVIAPPEVLMDERLRRIEAGVEELRQSALKDARREIEDKKKGSRSTVTIAFALIGAKIGAAIAGKGLIVTARNKEKGKAFEDFKKEAKGLELPDVVMLGFKKVFEFLETDFLKEIGSKAFIWGGVGAAIGGFIGWARGDRIHDVHDLIKHPIDSLKKIFGFKPKDPEPQTNLAQPPAKTQNAVIPPKEEDTKNRADWQSKEQAARNEKAEAVEASAFLAM